MPRVIEKTVFQFDELTDGAKETAREWFRQCLAGDSDYSLMFDDFERVAQILGIEFDSRSYQTMGGKTGYEPKIYFSGFCSQGDGACFEGSYSYAKGAAKKIRAYAPKDETLHNIADELQTIQKQAGYGLQANMTHSGHYYNSGCMAVDVSHAKDWNVELWNNSLARIMRDFAEWMYSQLELEHEYQNSDAVVDETIEANEYEFDAEGNRDH